MKKNSLFLLVIISMNLFSQRNIYSAGDFIANLGLGFSSTLYSNNYSPTFSFEIERGMAKLGPGMIAAGFIGQYQVYNVTNGSVQYNFKSLALDIRSAYYPDVLNTKIIHVYGAFTLGYLNNQNTITGLSSGTPNYNGLTNGLNVGICAGARLFLKPKVAIFGEAGYDISPIRVGLSAKF